MRILCGILGGVCLLSRRKINEMLGQLVWIAGAFGVLHVSNILNDSCPVKHRV